VTKSAWNFQTRATLADQMDAIKFGRPAGGTPVAV